MKKRAIYICGISLCSLSAIASLILHLPAIFAAHQTHGYEKAMLITELFTILTLSLFGVYFLKSKLYTDKLEPTVSRFMNGKTIVFFSILLLTQVMAFFFLAATNGHASRSFLFQDAIDSYMDFYNSMYTKNHPDAYKGGPIYPPICYVIYGIFASIIPSEIFSNPSWRDAAFQIRNSQAGKIALVAFLAIALISFIYSVFFARKKFSVGASLMIVLSLVLTAPAIFAIERGNIILYSLPAIIFFIYGYNSENKIVKEISLIALAFSTTIKITPALFYLILLFDKKYKEFLRAIIYAAILFFIPFAYYGGFEQIPDFIKNVFSFSGASSPPELLPTIPHVNTTSFSGGLNFIFTIFTGNFATQSFHSLGGVILSLALLIATFFTKGWRRIMCITLVLIGLFRSNTPYVMIYIFVPLIAFLDEDFSKKRWLDGIYMFLFLCMTVLFPSLNLLKIGKMPLWTLSQTSCPLLSVVIQNLSMLLISLVLIFDIAITFTINKFKKVESEKS